MYNHGHERSTQVGEKASGSGEELKSRLLLACRPCSEKGLEEGLDLRIVNSEMSLEAIDTDENS